MAHAVGAKEVSLNPAVNKAFPFYKYSSFDGKYHFFYIINLEKNYLVFFSFYVQGFEASWLVRILFSC